MEAEKTQIEWNYAYLTFKKGGWTFTGVEMILENMVMNFEAITNHPCGSFSYTNDRLARAAVSNTAIVMSYSLLEGFFHEEYMFYLKHKKPNKPKKLTGLISTLLREHNISIKDWRMMRKKIDLLRVLRNAAVHSNGMVEEDIDRNLCKNVFGEDIFQLHEGLPVLSLHNSISLVRECRTIANEYAEKVFMNR